MGLKETRKNFGQNSRCFRRRISSQICQRSYRLNQFPGTQYVHPTAQTFSSPLDFRQFLGHKYYIHLKAVCWVFYCQNFVCGFNKPHLDLDLRTHLLRYIISFLFKWGTWYRRQSLYHNLPCNRGVMWSFPKKNTDPMFLEKLRVGSLLGY